MPELPDVETILRDAKKDLVGRTIQGAEVRSPRILGRLPAERFAEEVKGERLDGARRYGKYLFLRTDHGPWIVFHFGLTGLLKGPADSLPPTGEDRVIFRLDRGVFAYANRRMIGRVGLTDDPDAFVSGKELGPDALSVTEKEFTRRLAGRSGELKAALMDQTFVAGLGNVYVDEIMYQARLHPRSPTSSLSDADRRRIYRTMMNVLKTAIDLGAEREKMPDNFLTPHRRKRGECPRGHGPFQIITAAGRTTYFCPSCQPLSSSKKRRVSVEKR
ncbi:MAG: Fpg/Nei family DNA glycosylase [Elusimicrobia bacterium]|nr:Fpg/Nei family DNA glycosylase [Elusimicrobiota bacterium]